MSEYIGTVESAKMIRKALKAKFPAVKFSVRSSLYAGGSSINVDWTDGPTAAAVDAVVKPYSGSGFDGMIDMKYNKDAVMLADGTVTYGTTYGTEGQRGSVPTDVVELPEGAKVVKFSVDYVFTHRANSPEAVKKALAAVVEQYGNQIGMPEDLAEVVKVSDYSGEGYLDPAFRDKDVTGEPGWNLHWSLGSVVGRVMQETEM